MHPLIQRIDRWANPRIAVVGDFMLDRQVFGNADRLSPDAPVPVLAVEREETRAGGAANVCACLRALRSAVLCLGVIGEDEPGRTLRRHLDDAGCDTAGLLALEGRPTTVKQSMVGLAQHRHPQKMFRLDYEDRSPVPADLADRLLQLLASRLPDLDLLCIEDYHKGLLTPELTGRLIRLAREAGKPVLVDPAAVTDYAKYRGATCLTPNRTEAERATGLPGDDEHLHDMAVRLRDQLDLDALVLTLDRHGALLLERGGEPQRLPTVARSVYDVTGAGDMVLAALAAARANHAPWPEAVELANLAAGLEVERFGVVPITLEEILVEALRREHGGSKVRTLDQLKPELDAYRRQGRTIAFTNGCFDILHPGHIHLLRGAAAQADLLVLAVNSDASIRALKGEDRPILPETDRLELLGELESVDYLILFGDGRGGEADTPRPLLRELKPDVLVKGGQYAHDEVVGWEIVESYGGKVATIPHLEGRSTTSIVEKILHRR